MVGVVCHVIRRWCFLSAISIGLARAQHPSSYEVSTLLERSSQILIEAIHQNKFEYNCPLREALYHYHSRTAEQLVLQNQIYPCGARSIDSQMMGAVLPLLEDRLRHGDEKEKPGAASLIGRASGDHAVAVLSTCARDQREPVASQCAMALYQMGTRAIPTIRTLAEHGTPAVRKTALSALGHLQDQRSLPILLRSLADRDPEVRLSAAGALAYLGNPGGARVLRQALGSAYPRHATLALAAIGDPVQIKVVQAWLEGSFPALSYPRKVFTEADAQSDFRLLNAQMLAEFRTVAAHDLIATVLETQRYQDRVIFVGSLRRPVVQLDPESLRLGLEDKDPHIRVMAAKIADEQGDPRGLDELSRLVTSPDEWVHGPAIVYLAEKHTPEAVSILRQVAAVKFSIQDDDVEFEDTTLQAAAISGIREGGNVSDVPLLMALVDDRSSNVACAAIDAIVTLSPGDAIQRLAPKLYGYPATAICAATTLAYLIERDK
jgi:HEAT repeat protein